VISTDSAYIAVRIRSFETVRCMKGRDIAVCASLSSGT